MNMHHPKANVEFTKGCGNRLKLTGIRSLEVPGPGAVAHMSLHQKTTMSKSRRDSYNGPLLVPRLTPGEPAVRICWRPMRWAVEAASAASVRAN